MKQTLKFFTFLFASTAFLLSISSCGGDDETGSGGDGGASETSITISSDRQFVIVETNGTFSFTVKNNLNTTVTSSSTIYVDGTSISGSTYTPSTLGSFSIYAKKGDLQSNTIIVDADSGVHSITITPNKLLAAPGEAVGFTVKDNLGRDLSSSTDVAFNANGTTFTPNEFTSNELGHFDIQATFTNIDGNTYNSNTVGVDYIELATSFKKKVLIEDYTGAWCGWCPRVAYGIELVEAETDFSIPVAVHNGDAMSYQYEATLRSYFGITGFPTGKLNRSIDWDYPENDNIVQVTDLIADNYNTGLAISSIKDGDNLVFDVAIGFASTRTENIGLVVYLLEDGITGTQTNYTSFYGGGSSIANFEYNDILRTAYTTLLGDDIPSSDTQTGDLTFKRFNVNIPSSVHTNLSSKLHLVAFIVDKTTKTVINAQVSTVDTYQSFD